jgi:predicted RNA binding protein YcfA (HicA-like mRNA interferase family)
MTQMPRITAKEAERIVLKLGFVLVRQSGSHRIYKNAAGQRVTIPFHGHKTLHPKVVRSIINDARITVEDFHRLLKE